MDRYGRLNIEKDTILEIACLISDQNLNIVSEEFNVVIKQSDTILNNMDDWNTIHHTKTGLIQASKASKISLRNAEQMLLSFLQKYIPKNSCPLAGNTIYMDRLFILKHMSLVNDYLHYRIIDVSTVQELVRRWNPTDYKFRPQKQYNHRALDDIKESIQELKYYKNTIFMPADTSLIQ
ncbi:oligoribonuclease, mitochondrial-like isoform X2 [Ceratina calcarata]|uniref:Probable oligoribonuclease n=1 Tax=Ceratina calcarata TaxID=156304 RepID=A0AAJ7NCB7_9HYME|nr:oligoribonuclease, mitochondrial-like isoform X2 [Ceratina calcarata]XP_017888211.1 oligoribonuclease, mitochondrial-like isoform X2 [Ceratina calcarata]XP_017888212.1 oligoribonuclease, mitochondrial-like isoform X2 [Ceratina calcarata]